MDIREKLELLVKKMDKDFDEEFVRQKWTVEANRYRAVLSYGKKYAKIDLKSGGQTSGRYMVDLDTGIIYGISGYGVPNKSKTYGNLDTIDSYYWGGYTPVKLKTAEDVKKQEDKNQKDLEFVIKFAKSSLYDNVLRRVQDSGGMGRSNSKKFFGMVDPYTMTSYNNLPLLKIVRVNNLLFSSLRKLEKNIKSTLNLKLTLVKGNTGMELIVALDRVYDVKDSPNFELELIQGYQNIKVLLKNSLGINYESVDELGW